MPQPLFITGEAGSGKTRKLMEEAARRGGELLKKTHQRLLAIAVMHGARRRLQSTLARHCPKLPVTVSTVHSLALKLVNRWRRSLGLSLQVSICESPCGLAEKHCRTQATFEEVIELACQIVASPTARCILADTYPLIIVDEFQDCTDGTLQLVQALTQTSTVLIAADHFQKLQDVAKGCPAVDWAESLVADCGGVREDLTVCRRTERAAILRAARALRDNVPAQRSTVPVYAAPNSGPAAWRIVGRFVPWAPDRITTGTCALIVLSLDDPLVTKVLASFSKQLSKHDPKRKITWARAIAEPEQHKQLREELGLHPGAAFWSQAGVGSGHLACAVARDVVRFCRLRGIGDIPSDLAGQFAKLAVRNSRAFGWSSPRYQVLTVHGAKNREFEHVFVLWATYKAVKWSEEERRRLLYNAVTRAKLDCTVLVLGDIKDVRMDPVITLLGPVLPAIDPALRRKKTVVPV